MPDRGLGTRGVDGDRSRRAGIAARGGRAPGRPRSDNRRRRSIDLTLGRIEYQHRPAIVGIGYDITVRKRAEAQVHQSEQRLCLALKAGRMGTFLHDFRRGVTNIDERECELFGLDPARREWPISAGLQVIDPPRPGAALAAGTLILFSFSHYSASVHAMEKYKQPTMPLVIIDSQKSNGAPG